MNSAELGQIGVNGLRGTTVLLRMRKGKNKGVFLTGSDKRWLGGGGAYPIKDSNIGSFSVENNK